jgi:hypothetical protein
VDGEGIIFRNDDVNPSSNFEEIKEIYERIRINFPKAEIWSGINIFSKSNDIGSVYPDLPLANKMLSYFYGVDSLFDRDKLNKLHTITSHGLIHFNHSKLSKDAQELSIVMSCNLLKTKIFIPPFNQFNEDTKFICNFNRIRLVMPTDGWKSLEKEKFNSEHKLWFFHSWRFTPDAFRKLIEN